MIKGFLLLLAMFGWALAAAALHVVVSPGDLTVVPKERLGLIDTYVDTRRWSMDDVPEHPVVIRRLISARKSSSPWMTSARGVATDFSDLSSPTVVFAFS